MKQRQEFNVGQWVTFHAFDKALKVQVKSVSRLNTWGKEDGRIWYEINGAVISTCTGLCIEESRYFEPFNKVKAATLYKH